MSSVEASAAHDFRGVRDDLREMVRLRDWEQFHTPRNLILALTGEVGELAELFQWRGDDQAKPGLPDFSKEITYGSLH
ncbi:unnamed protein product [Amoebophrya sp. A25]|nr:unnamed protein product [Amoebophrya sp. A25]|eukprot:GSA25T00014446001.1